MKNKKKILAIACIIFLLSFFVLGLIFALINTDTTILLLKVCIAGSLFFPVMIYILLMLFKMNKNNNQFSDNNDLDNDN